ncbi:Fasciclin-domain-containing protein [Coprinopsis marcescibilis]|uniref:Fasciclin-domain-containing protein n=1 Tax=Coprinopsis marcescibilis TaxID=230819 RepID=A0A5C3KVA9_COPMA|nr:Fasciclin-domain-containing protein [Coprinopsis marcescibilis]
MYLTSLPLSLAVAALPFLTTSNGQLSSSQPGGGGESLSTSATSSAASGEPSASSTPGGGGGSSSGGFLQEYLVHLNNTGYTSLSSALQQANQTESGQQWLGQLADGNWTVFAPGNDAFSRVPGEISSNATLLADCLSYHYVYGDLHNTTLAAGAGAGGGGGGGGSCTASQSQQCTATSQNAGGGGSGGMMSSTETQGSPTTSQAGGGGSTAPTASNYFIDKRISNPQFLQQDNSSSGIQLLGGPGSTVGRTTLSSPQFVQLEGNKSQVLAWVRSSPEENFRVLNQKSAQNGSDTVYVRNATQWRNLVIADVTDVFLPPGNITSAINGTDNGQFLNYLAQAQVPTANGTNGTGVEALQQARGFTLFYPNDDSLSGDAQSTLQQLQQNPEQYQSFLENHYINGSTVYGPTLLELASNASSGGETTTYTSDAGQYFSFSSNDTGLFVSAGNDTSAQVVRSDIFVENGVVHLIDRVLYQTANNAAAASSAFFFASSAATNSATDTDFIIFPVPTNSGGTGQSMSSESQSQSQSETSSSSSATSSSAAESPPTASGFRFNRALRW